MKKIIIISLILLAGVFSWRIIGSRDEGLEPLYTEPYIVVYGRDSCGLTRGLIQSLDSQSIYYVYKNIDLTGVKNELHPRMEKAGFATSRYGLPVVDVNSVIFIRPKLETILKQYSKVQGSTYDGSQEQGVLEARGSKVTGAAMEHKPATMVDGNLSQAVDPADDPIVLQSRKDQVDFRDPEGKIVIKELK